MAANVDTLTEPLRSAAINLMAAAKAAGKSVTVISARRTTAEQIALRKQNCATVQGQPTEADIYTRPAGQCSPETAIPGASKHELGQAVDFGGDLEWIDANASRFGLTRTVASEKWHYEHVTTAQTGDRSPDSSGMKSGGISIGNIPGLIFGLGGATAEAVVPGYGAVKDTASAAVSVAQAVLDPRTWIRAVGIVAGLGLTVIGLNMISRDIGGPSVSASGLAATAARVNPSTAAGAAAAAGI